MSDIAARAAALTPEAQHVLADCLDEIESNLDHSDVHTVEDIAADVVAWLQRTHLGAA